MWACGGDQVGWADAVKLGEYILLMRTYLLSPMGVQTDDVEK